MNLFDDYSALDNVLVALPGGAGARAFDAGATLRATRRATTRRRDVLARVGLAGKEHVTAKDLSYGDRRALEIGVALAARPRLLFLDEPTAGPGHRGHRAPRRADRASSKRTLTIVIIEHDMQFLFGLADRISVIHWGQVIAQGTPGRAARQSLGAALQPGGAARDASSVARHRHLLRRDRRCCSACRWRCARGRGRGAARPERRRQDDDAALDPRPDAGARAATIRFDGSDITRAPTHEIARARHRLGAGRPAHLPDADGGAQPVDRAQEDALSRLDARRNASSMFTALRVPDAPRVREPLRRRDADGGDLARAGRLRRGWCCSTSRARASRRRSCRT